MPFPLSHDRVDTLAQQPYRQWVKLVYIARDLSSQPGTLVAGGPTLLALGQKEEGSHLVKLLQELGVFLPELLRVRRPAAGGQSG